MITVDALACRVPQHGLRERVLTALLQRRRHGQDVRRLHCYHFRLTGGHHAVLSKANALIRLAASR